MGAAGSAPAARKKEIETCRSAAHAPRPRINGPHGVITYAVRPLFRGFLYLLLPHRRRGSAPAPLPRHTGGTGFPPRRNNVSADVRGFRARLHGDNTLILSRITPFFRVGCARRCRSAARAPRPRMSRGRARPRLKEGKYVWSMTAFCTARGMPR